MDTSRRLLLASALAIPGLGHGLPVLAAASRSALSLSEFGIAPDEARDQSVELQKAIAAAAARGLPLVLPAGRLIAKGLSIRQSMQLVGSTGLTTLISSDGGAVLVAEGAEDVTLFGLRFDGAGRSGTGNGLVLAANCERLIIDSCVFLGSSASGLSLNRCSGKIAGNRFGFIDKTGLLALDSKGLEISGNHVHDIGNNGIQVWRSEKGEDGTIVANNRVERVAAKDGGTGQNGNGINVYRAGNVLIANNRVTDCAFSAIRNNSGSNCQILGNSISRTDEVAIFVEFAFDGAVVSGNLIEKPALGISVTNLDHGGRLAVVSNNVIRDVRGPVSLAATSGTGIGVEADTVVTGNVVENAPDTGIHLGWGRYSRNLSATANIVRGCNIGIGASLAEGAGPALIANNVISGSKTAAILGMDHDNPVTGDLGKPGADVPERITLSANLVT